MLTDATAMSVLCQMQTMARSERYRGLGYSEPKSHLSYFDEYFSTVGAKMILIENPYTDRDYLENCAAYYARCDAGYMTEAPCDRASRSLAQIHSRTALA
jgi:hypothetical protein